MRTVSFIAYLVLLMTLVTVVLHMVGPAFVEAFIAFMFADYADYFGTYIAPLLPGWGNPLVMLIMAAIVIVLLPGLLNLSRFAAKIFIALCVTRVAFLLLGLEGASPPSLTTLAAATFAAGWLLVTGVFIARGPAVKEQAS